MAEGAFSAGAAGTTAASFLRAPFGARAAAMGGAQAASARGAEALFQNPAALALLEPESASEVAVGYESLLETAYQGAAAYARPLGREGALGLGFLHASQSAQTAYDARGDAAGRFAPLDLAAGAAYARRLGPAMMGAGFKLIRSSIDDRSGLGAAVDLGFLLRHATDLGESPLDIGAGLSNLGPPLKLGETSDPLPLRARAGALWHMSPVFDAAVDVVFPADQEPFAALGLEAVCPASSLGSRKPWAAFLRAGYDQSRARGLEGLAGVSAGAGVDLSSLRVDYAWVPMGDLGTTNRVTLAFRF